jgi:hypothetical protein
LCGLLRALGLPAEADREWWGSASWGQFVELLEPRDGDVKFAVRVFPKRHDVFAASSF